MSMGRCFVGGGSYGIRGSCTYFPVFAVSQADSGQIRKLTHRDYFSFAIAQQYPAHSLFYQQDDCYIPDFSSSALFSLQLQYSSANTPSRSGTSIEIFSQRFYLFDLSISKTEKEAQFDQAITVPSSNKSVEIFYYIFPHDFVRADFGIVYSHIRFVYLDRSSGRRRGCSLCGYFCIFSRFCYLLFRCL